MNIKEISKLLPKNFQYFYLPPIVNQAIPLLLLPILTFYLSTDDYGAMAIITSIVSILTPIMMMGSSNLMEIDYPSCNKEQLRKKISTWIITPFILLLIFTSIIFLLEDFIISFFKIDKVYFYFAFMITFLNILPRILLVYLIVSQSIRAFVTVEISQLLINAAASLYFVTILVYGLDGRLYGISLALIFVNITALIILNKYINFFAFSKKEFINLISFGSGLLPHTVLSHLNRQIDRYFIIVLVGANFAGLYYLSVQISSVLLEIFVAFNMAWSPLMMRKLRIMSLDNHKEIVKSIYLVGFIYLIIFICFQIAIEFLFPYIVNEKFNASQEFIFNLSLGNLFIGYYMLVVCIIFYSKKTYILSILNTVLTIITLPLYYFSVKFLGAIGASYVYLFYCFSIFVATFIISNKLYPLPWIRPLRDIMER